MSAQRIRLLVVGTGGMARAHVEAFSAIDGVEIVAGIDRDANRLATFCDEHGIEKRFQSVDEALEWGEFDAVTNVTPDAVHCVTTLPFLEAKKHVLCEKPLAVTHADASRMAEAATNAGVVNMVNLTYRNGPAMQTAAKMVASGEIGEVRHFDASYLQSWLTQDAWGKWDEEEQWLWRLSSAHGSKGVLGDVGVHILDYATHVAGSAVASVSCRLKTFDKAPGNRIDDYVLDANDSCMMHLELANGATGVLHASRFASGHINDLSLSIYGDKGGLEVRATHGVNTLRASTGEDLLEGVWRDVEIPESEPWVFERFISAIRGEGQMDPDFARGADLQKVLDLAVESDEAKGIITAVQA